MKKKPIYLWVLLILSALCSGYSLLGVLVPIPKIDHLPTIKGVSAEYNKQMVAYTIKIAEHNHSLFNVILIVLSAVLVTAALVYLVRDNIQLANYIYIGYIFLAIIGTIYNFLGVQQGLALFTDPNIRMGAGIGANGVIIVFIIINIVFLALVFYNMWRQQKELAEASEEQL